MATNAPASPTAPIAPSSGYYIKPRSIEGKHRTSLNAYKHGLTGQIHIFSAEEQKAFETHCTGIVEALAPVGALETDIAQSIAQNRWRLKRVATIESGIFAIGHEGELGIGIDGAPYRTDPAQVPIDDAKSPARTWLAKADNIQLLALYEQRINRTVERSMVELRTLRAETESCSARHHSSRPRHSSADSGRHLRSWLLLRRAGSAGVQLAAAQPRELNLLHRRRG